MIVLGAGWPGRTSLGIFLPRPPHRQVSPFTSVERGRCGVFNPPPPRGTLPSSGPSGPACLGGEGGCLALAACVYLLHRQRLIPAA